MRTEFKTALLQSSSACRELLARKTHRYQSRRSGHQLQMLNRAAQNPVVTQDSDAPASNRVC